MIYDLSNADFHMSMKPNALFYVCMYVCMYVMGCTKFTTSGAHDVIAITSPQQNDLCTEKLRDEHILPSHWTKSCSLPHRKARFSCLFLR